MTVEAYTHGGTVHWRDRHGQITHHRPENCPCAKETNHE